jgi:hypothetical protein
MKTKILTCLLILSCLFCGATNKIVVANSGQGWSNGNNFSPNGIPQSGDSVTIPAGVMLTVKGNIYTNMPLLKVYVYGTMDFDPSGKLDLTISSLVQIYSGGKITTNGTSSEIISMGGVVKYNGHNDGTVTGPKYASAATSISDGIADDAGFNFGVLPLPILSFGLRSYNNEVALNWKLNPQAGIDKYVIQKRINGDWQNLKQEQLNPRTSAIISYSYVDQSPGQGEVFYRLKLINYQGKVEYSKVVMARINPEANSITLYPNPVQTKAVLTLKRKLNKGKISVFTVAGVEVYGKKIDNYASRVQVDFSGLKKGLYHVIVSDGTVIIDKTAVILTP